MTKEEFYDEHINPLVLHALKLARRAGISALITFELDADADGEPLYCTTVSMHPDASERLRAALVLLTSGSQPVSVSMVPRE